MLFIRNKRCRNSFLVLSPFRIQIDSNKLNCRKYATIYFGDFIDTGMFFSFPPISFFTHTVDNTFLFCIFYWISPVFKMIVLTTGWDELENSILVCFSCVVSKLSRLSNLHIID